MNNRLIKLSIGILCFGLFVTSSNINAQKKDKKEYDIAAIVWPSYHPDDRAKIFWPDGIGEWQTVISNKPLITINSWNEWTETSYIMPCTMHGYGYLEAIKRVFVESEK